ncbi:MAG: M20/M25/M40 family metallo-hydrolase [Thermoleophilaceae bacterium]
MEAAAALRATREEKDRLLHDFIRLCEIPSPSGRERRVADVVTAELEEVGLEVLEDETGAETGSDSGNLLARVPGPDESRTILLCAHLDTVPLAAPVEVANEEGLLTNRNDAILGADNKTAVAILVAVARRLARDGSPVGVDLLFTTCEELGLLGARFFDSSLLRAEYGYVFDHASPVGEVIVAAPTYYRIGAHFHGHAAHAGVRPEDGRNAIAAAARALDRMRFGRIDEGTTANAGTIQGGTARNVVAEHCHVELEARSLDQARAAGLVSEMVDAITEAASDFECDVETDVAELSRGFRLAPSSQAVTVATQALEGVGVAPVLRPTGGGSDANVFNLEGIPCVNLADGVQHNHEPTERVSVDSLERMLDVALGLVARSA